MEKLPEPKDETDKFWYESYEWGPEPDLIMPASEEALGEDF